MHQALIDLLKRRESVIADHPWRDRDPAGHLDALREVSEAITAWHQANQYNIDSQLRHYLQKSSFAKALAHLESATA
ncbi:MAG: hypothetical protein ACK49N_12240 [Verrucomicrobiota bacterium]